LNTANAVEMSREKRRNCRAAGLKRARLETPL
jgi:hypothetical protein